ncbi:hypothetical protein PAAG_07914 [Paracoccidioides lutzii Pb01]|uniref:Uncharacterized protein n=1 Tax=Paracoccidioides lutzii (strain ATCC MYA-826 / Pb01) TaxID=502779 RepID=C1HAT5_PARBA|nr:hypothetical protein PAAG_07914 [Paracoccidioides lutzii Pb01]EEH37496.2 hypothetical protein PAAG_07914 [Paracoccidioides lutzii Pb01]
MEVCDGWAPLREILGINIPDEPFPRANDSYAIEGLAQQIVLEARSSWAGIFAVTGALGYGAWWLRKSSIVRVAIQTGLEGINACSIALAANISELRVNGINTKEAWSQKTTGSGSTGKGVFGKGGPRFLGKDEANERRSPCISQTRRREPGQREAE